MKRVIILLVVLALLIISAAYYFLRPAPSPVSIEIQDFLVDACVEQAAQYSAFAEAVDSGDTGKCEELNPVNRPLCVAALTQNPAVCETAEEDMQERCRALAARQSICGQSISRFACEAAAKGEPSYFAPEKVRGDCEDMVRYEAALESRDKRNCEKINRPDVKEDCVSVLA
jgi:hypothetical protein